jgi:hypothetical protein
VTADPKRLTVVGATDLERSLLSAARRERPSPEMTARMAAGLGISVGAAITAASAPVAAAPVVAAKTMLGLWVPAGVIVAAVAAGVVGVRFSARPDRPAAHVAEPAAPTAEPIVADAPRAIATRPVRAAGGHAEKIRRRPAAVAPTPATIPADDLRDQIALIDAARAAVTGGSSERALALLRRYDASYPGGAFRPEALALRIEALAHDGRRAEAQGLARDFLARYPQSPVAARVARIAGK